MRFPSNILCIFLVCPVHVSYPNPYTIIGLIGLIMAAKNIPDSEAHVMLILCIFVVVKIL